MVFQHPSARKHKLALKKYWHPTLVFGSLLVMLIWYAANAKVVSEQKVAEDDAISDLVNYSLLFKEDVLRRSLDLDRVLHFVRRSYERSGYHADWRALLAEEFTANAGTVQFAVIDRDGIMVTSTALPVPAGKIDLSDREHYKYHRDAISDTVHVSKPVLGRASNRWSIQYTRKFTDRAGHFAGVIVASLDPELLLASYRRLASQPRIGFALLGEDLTIKAGAGLFASQVGSQWNDGNDKRVLQTKGRDVDVSDRDFGGWRSLVAVRGVPGLPMSVAMTLRLADNTASLVWNEYYLGASVLSLAIYLAVFGSHRRQRRHVTHMTRLAHSDTLTKLPNRLSFQQTIKALINENSCGGRFALHLIDLDHFKAVNDTHGHPVGDELLRKVAERLKASVRVGDIVFRLGGDEFALLQIGITSIEDAEVVAQRICQVLANPFDLSGIQVFVGASIGIAILDDELCSAPSLLKAADIALYRAKDMGRGTHCPYSKDISDELQARRELEREIRSATAKRQIEVHYQPKVDLTDGNRIVGYEALVRWRHPERGLVPPIDFIQVAEESGSIVAIGAWVLEQACADFVHRPDDQTVAVNCSAIQLSHGNFLETVTQVLSRTSLPARRLEIEITETALMSQDASVLGQLEGLRQLGVRIAMDDFGTGYSSLGYLERYPIDCIKIDRSFVSKLGEEPRAAAITRIIISLAAELKICVVAEGIESRSQADLLAAMGCRIGQGYLFGRPALPCELWPKEQHRRSA